MKTTADRNKAVRGFKKLDKEDRDELVLEVMIRKSSVNSTALALKGLGKLWPKKLEFILTELRKELPEVFKELAPAKKEKKKKKRVRKES